MVRRADLNRRIRITDWHDRPEPDLHMATSRNTIYECPAMIQSVSSGRVYDYRTANIEPPTHKIIIDRPRHLLITSRNWVYEEYFEVAIWYKVMQEPAPVEDGRHFIEILASKYEWESPYTRQENTGFKRPDTNNDGLERPAMPFNKDSFKL